MQLSHVRWMDGKVVKYLLIKEALLGGRPAAQLSIDRPHIPDLWQLALLPQPFVYWPAQTL